MEAVTFDKLLTAAIVVLIIINAYNTIHTAIKNRREEKAIQSSPVSTLKERVDKHETMLQNDKRNIDDMAEDIKSTKNALSVLLRSNRALLSHGINGNSIEKLKASADEIDEYLISRR